MARLEPLQSLGQRCLDGEATPDQAATWARLRQDRCELDQAAAELEQLDGLLAQEFGDRRLVADERDRLCEALHQSRPHGRPECQRGISVAGIAMAVVAVAAAAPLTWALRRGLDHDLISLVTIVLVTGSIGLLVTIVLPPLLRPDETPLTRLIGRRVLLSPDQQLALRCLGLAVILGGLGALI